MVGGKAGKDRICRACYITEGLSGRRKRADQPFVKLPRKRGRPKLAEDISDAEIEQMFAAAKAAQKRARLAFAGCVVNGEVGRAPVAVEMNNRHFDHSPCEPGQP